MSKKAVQILILFFILIEALAWFNFFQAWPFIPYNMYTDRQAQQTQVLSLIGFDDFDQPQKIDFRKFSYPYHENLLPVIVKLKQEQNSVRLKEIVGGLIERFNLQESKKIVAAKLFILNLQVPENQMRPFSISNKELIIKWP